MTLLLPLPRLLVHLLLLLLLNELLPSLAEDGARTVFSATEAADALDRRADAGRLLRTARARLDAALAGYRAALAVDPTRDEAQRRLTDAIAAGKPCCGRRSLWVEYGVE